ncbi:Uncharacterised protein [Enterobacter ludwigii]|nr:hypothetical protein EcloH_3216 [Enterobacter ludwigii]CAH0290354.1 hypothetical protein SRABI45_04075 [Enterobacter ludwigii]VAG35823.1 Uncharacterised protein [Enterobacter ludwigii]VAG78530.1 Uncharacterised protein [Enterobacter ludwigii]
MCKHHGATGKITDNVRGDYYPIAFRENFNGVNAIVERITRRALPRFDCRVPPMGFTFVEHDGIEGKTALNAGNIGTIADRKIG